MGLDCILSFSNDGSVHCKLRFSWSTVPTFWKLGHIVQCTLYNVHCILYNVHCTMHTVQCTLYSTQTWKSRWDSIQNESSHSFMRLNCERLGFHLFGVIQYFSRRILFISTQANRLLNPYDNLLIRIFWNIKRVST